MRCEYDNSPPLPPVLILVPSPRIGHSMALDSLARSEKISFFRNLPDLKANIAEGFLEKYDPLTGHLWITYFLSRVVAAQ